MESWRPHAISVARGNLAGPSRRTHAAAPRTKTDANKNFISLYGIIKKIWDQQTTAHEVYCLVGISLWSHYWFHVPPFNCHFDDFQNITNLANRRSHQTLLIDIYLRLMFFSAQNSKTNSAGAKFPLIVGILGAKGAEPPPPPQKKKNKKKNGQFQTQKWLCAHFWRLFPRIRHGFGPAVWVQV